MCHWETTVAHVYGPEFAHPVADGERRGVTSWGMSRRATDPDRPLEGDPWRWYNTMMSVPTMLRARHWRWQGPLDRAGGAGGAVMGKS